MKTNNPTLRIMNDVNTLLYTSTKPNIKAAIEILENEGNDTIRAVYYARPMVQEYLDNRSKSNGKEDRQTKTT